MERLGVACHHYASGQELIIDEQRQAGSPAGRRRDRGDGPARAAITGQPAGRPTATSPTLWAWGDNPWSQLGNGTAAAAMIPSAVELPPGVTMTGVAGGLSHGLALTSTGGVLSWGKNFRGALGDGTQAGSKTPVWVAIPAGVKVTVVRAGCSDSLALTAAGQLLAWGAEPIR